MSGNVITNHGTPVNGTDAVNKDYVDNLVSTGTGMTEVTITLTGTAYTSAIPETKGVLSISIKNIIPNGPSAAFYISKSESSGLASEMRLLNTPGAGSGELLELKWDPLGNVQIRKTGAAYDGTYKVSYLLTA